MIESEYPDIRSLDLFSEMDEEHFEALMRGSYVQNFPPLIELITEGEPSDFHDDSVRGDPGFRLFASGARTDAEVSEA